MPPLGVGHADGDLAVEAAGAAQRLVDGVDAVGGADDDDVLPRLEAVHQREELGDHAALDLTLGLLALGCDRVELVDEDDRGRLLARLLEDLAQPLLGLAVEAPHDLGAVDVEEVHVGLGGDRLGEQRLAGARRPVQQHALGRVDAEPLEQLGVLERQLDHLAHLGHGVAQPADVVVGDLGAPRLLDLDVLGEQLDLGLLGDAHDAARAHRDDAQADLLQREGGLREEGPEDVVGCALAVEAAGGALVHGGGHDVAGEERAPEEGLAQRLARAGEAEVLLRRRQHDAPRRLGVGRADLHVVADGDVGVGALQAIEAHELEPLVVGVGWEHDGGGGALADDLDHVPLLEAQLGDVQAGGALADVLRLGGAHLQPNRVLLWHRDPPRRVWSGSLAGLARKVPAASAAGGAAFGARACAARSREPASGGSLAPRLQARRLLWLRPAGSGTTGCGQWCGPVWPLLKRVSCQRSIPGSWSRM